MDLQIFDVGHGACALLTCDDNTRMMLDCGYNADTGWSPGRFLAHHGIKRLEVLSITNFDEDHCDGLEDLARNVNIERIYRNPSVDSATIDRLKSADGIGDGVHLLFRLLDTAYPFRGAQVKQPPFAGLTYQAFFHSYPTFTDENNLSVVNFLMCHGTGIMFTGDLERDGWLEMLKKPGFVDALRRTHLLVAPHHGRENGCCEEAMLFCENLQCVIISDKDHMYETQQTGSFYRRFTRGGLFRGEQRYILSTRSDGSMGFTITPQGAVAQRAA